MNHFRISDILLKGISCFYILLDTGYNIKATNDDSAAIFSSQTFEIGKNFFDHFNEKSVEKFAFAFASVTKGNSIVVKAPIENAGKAVTIKWNICAVCDDSGMLTGFELLGVPLNTVVKRSELEQKEEPSSNFLSDFNSKPSFSLDLCGNFTSFDNAFANLAEYTATELLHTSFFALADPASLASLNRFVTGASKGIPQKYNCRLLNKRGEKVLVNIVNTPIIEAGTFVGVNAFIHRNTGKPFVENVVNRDERRLKLVLGKVKKVLDFSLDMICAIDKNGRFTNISAACNNILGYKKKELIGKRYLDFVCKDDIRKSKRATAHIRAGVETTNFENRFYKKDGTLAHLVWSSRWEESDKRFYCIARDATEKKESEAALKASEEKYRILFYNHPIPSWIYDVETLRFLEVNDAAILHYGYSREAFLNMTIKDVISENEMKRFTGLAGENDFDAQNHKGLWLHKKSTGELFYAEIRSNRIDFNGRKAKLVLSIDRTEQTMAEQELLKSNERYSLLSEATFDGIWECDLATNEVQWNEGARKMFELKDPDLVLSLEWWLASLHDEDRQRVYAKMKDYLGQKSSMWEDEYRFKTASGTYKYIYNRAYIIYDGKSVPLRMIGAMQDLTERKAHENMLQNLNHSLEKRAKELAESNAELERFAYVASHDLQEPLRMVTSFLQLLEKRYKDKLDNKAGEYINYAVDGAERMKRLILDLLEYSRVNSSKAEVEDVDVNEVVKGLKITYKNIIKETGGMINTVSLPVIKGNKTQIMQLFQNLIGNAFKYKSAAPPFINIFYADEDLFYKFSIADNGIGIDPKFFHKIFIIFQRLHNRDEFSGTGIGLAICKKIIDKHGGKIWVTSVPGAGSTFHFTLPKS